MHSIPLIAAFLQAGLFKWQDTIVKQLQEQGMSSLTVMQYQRFAVIPGIVLLAISFRQEYIYFLLSNPLVLGAVIFCGSVWMLHVYLRMHVLDTVNSMSFFNAFNAIITLPIYLAAGVLINRDLPNWHIGGALILLSIALLIQPTTHEANKQKKTFRMSLALAILLAFLGHLIDAVNMGSYRYFLEHFNATLFGLALFMTLSMGVICIFFMIRRSPISHKKVFAKHGYWPFLIPVIWSIGTFCEGYALVAIPIYTLIALAAGTFLIDIWSDLRHHRINFDIRTALFVALVLGSTALSVISTN